MFSTKKTRTKRPLLVEYNANDRKKYLTGFRKRNLERKKQKEAQILKMKKRKKNLKKAVKRRKLDEVMRNVTSQPMEKIVTVVEE